MSTSSHTPEPWFICSTEPAEIRTHPYLGSVIGHTIPNAHNAHRIVACVNACQGMTDPAAEIEAMRAAITGVSKILRSIELNDIFEETMRNHAVLALTKLAPFLP